MKDKRYSIQKIFGGIHHKQYQVQFNSQVLTITDSRYKAEQCIVQHKKERTQEYV